jgi:hypothetical protein
MYEGRRDASCSFEFFVDRVRVHVERDPDVIDDACFSFLCTHASENATG